MKKYSVHVFTIVRVKMEPVEAESQIEAIKKATELFHNTIPDIVMEVPNHICPEVVDIEDAEEISHFLVDEVGDEEYEKSRFYKADGVTIDNLE